MRQSSSFRILATVVATGMLTLGSVQSADAGVVSTEAAMQMEERAERIERVTSVLAREGVQQQLVKLGVDPADAEQRVASLSDSELQALEQRMDELPAGANGALEVLGIVLLVLLVLELVGVTDIFKSI